RAAARPDETLVVHHVDADAEAADHRALVGRVVGAVGGVADSGGAGPADPAALRAALRHALRSAVGRIVIVLDGVDRLDDVDGAPDLRWLPTDVPANVRIVVTASGDRPRAAVDHRGWP